MITADEARKLAGRTLDEKIELLGRAIEESAKNKRRCLRTSWEHKEDDDLWVNGGYSQTDEWKEAKKRLEKLGYKVTFFYKETQFVDMYTLIEW